MPKKKIKDVSPEDKLRTEAINECKLWVDMANNVLITNRDKVKDITNLMTLTNESRITWLERCAMVLNIDVRRTHVGAELVLAWSDMEGNILREDDSEDSKPLRTFTCVEDLLNLRVDAKRTSKASEVEQ